MWGFLALIGLLFLMYWASKALVRLGNFLIRLSEELGDYVIMVHRKRGRPPVAAENKEIKDKMSIIKGEDTDDEFMEKARKEIEKFTDTDV